METRTIGKIHGNIVLSEVRVKYCLYARKSTESDEMQALSIDSQNEPSPVQAHGVSPSFNLK